MGVRNVERDQIRRIEVRFHSRNRLSTSAAPGIGFREIRSNLALNSAADLPRRRVPVAGTSLIQGLPQSVTRTVSPPNARSPSLSNRFAASFFVTVFMCQTHLISSAFLRQ